jgi:hypothetical protein
LCQHKKWSVEVDQRGVDIILTSCTHFDVRSWFLFLITDNYKTNHQGGFDLFGTPVSSHNVHMAYGSFYGIKALDKIAQIHVSNQGLDRTYHQFVWPPCEPKGWCEDTLIKTFTFLKVGGSCMDTFLSTPTSHMIWNMQFVWDD